MFQLQAWVQDLPRDRAVVMFYGSAETQYHYFALVLNVQSWSLLIGVCKVPSYIMMDKCFKLTSTAFKIHNSNTLWRSLTVTWCHTNVKADYWAVGRRSKNLNKNLQSGEQKIFNTINKAITNLTTPPQWHTVSFTTQCRKIKLETGSEEAEWMIQPGS